MIRLYVGWEDAMLEQHKNHKHGRDCLAGCRELTKNVRARIKTLTRMVTEGTAIVVEKGGLNAQTPKV
jgi:hypothetical protein